ncbi:MAG: hypothetical protein JNL80_08095 [Phycisphaerae bacterium]|nr:hypothetical protein [Phycisphaerae bacterium]
MPGLKRCGRCASALDFTGVDFVPPRASRGGLAQAIRTRLDRDRFATGRGFAALARRARGIGQGPASWRPVWLSIVPGLGQVALGDRRFGRAILGSWLGCLLLLLLYVGGAAEWFFYLLLVGIHTFAVSLLFVVSLQSATLLRRMLTGFGIWTMLNLALYLPGRWLANRIVVVTEVNHIIETPFIRDGDVIMYPGPWMRPESFQVGDLVLYRIVAGAGQGYLIRAGYSIDRIIATEGDLVRIRDGVLSVNDVAVPPEHQPLNGLARMGDAFEARVRPGHVFIIPSALQLTTNNGANLERAIIQTYREATQVPVENVLGKVLWRLRPWSRFGTLEPARDSASGATP